MCRSPSPRPRLKRKKSKRKKRSKTPTKLKWADEVEEGRLRFVQWLMPFIMSKRDSILIKSWFQFQLEEMIHCNQSLPSALS